MKTRNHSLKSIGIFALILVMLVSVVLPASVAGSSVDPDTVSTYTVKKGDTLSSIAATYGVTVSNIVTKNGISASSELYVGQKLQIPGAVSVDQDSTTTYGSSSSISIDFTDADLVGVLETILAHTGYTMIFKGETANVTISLDNVSPIAAIDYVLRMADMTYIKNDNIIYVGAAEVLNSSFIDSLALTQFKLRYISTDTLTSQLSALGVDVNLVKVDINLREFWISGYPMQLAKVRELIDTLDNKTNITVGSASISSYLSAIDLKYITATEFSTLLSSLGLHAGITTQSHPMTLYVYATGDAYNDIMNIKKLVDYKDASAVDVTTGNGGTGSGTGGNATTAPNSGNNNNNTTDSNGSTNNNKPSTSTDVIISNGETSLVKIDLQFINKDDVKSIITTFGYDVEVLGLDLYEKRVWLRGSTDTVNKAVNTIKENDTEENNTNKTSFTYELKNIVASELQSKIAFADLEGVEFYFGSYPELTKSFVVFCPANQVETVKELIASLDNNLGKMYYPIATLTSTDDLKVLAAKEELVVKLLNNSSITTAAFEVSGDLDPSDAGVKYVLYVLESPENVTLITDMWTRIG